MLSSGNLFHLLASLNTAVLALPSDFHSPPYIQSREIRSLANSVLVNNSLTETTNLTLATTSFPEYDTSSNAEPTVFCHIDPPLPAPPKWGNVDLVECGLLILTMLANDSADLHASRWSPTHPIVLPWTWGFSPYCKIRITAVSPRSPDFFQRVMIAQRVALVLTRCMNNKGGIVSLGSREQFQIEVVAFLNQATA